MYCRSEDDDFLYALRWQKMQRNGIKTLIADVPVRSVKAEWILVRKKKGKSIFILFNFSLVNK